MRIAFIGFGEVGQRFAADFSAHREVRLAAYDLKFDRPGSPNEAVARRLGVQVVGTAAAAMAGADCVISAVTADVAEAVARSSVAHLAPGQLYFDVNSAAPTTKARAAAALEACGARYVEGAVMGPVAGPGIRVQILAGGGAAPALADRLNSLGMNIAPVATEFGRASAMKLCRSIMIKGIEALIGDCARAAAHWEVEQQVFASLADTFPGTDWSILSRTMGERVARHGVRRAAEMREAAEMITAIGIDDQLCRAVADAHQRGARPMPTKNENREETHA